MQWIVCLCICACVCKMWMDTCVLCILVREACANCVGALVCVYVYCVCLCECPGVCLCGYVCVCVCVCVRVCVPMQSVCPRVCVLGSRRENIWEGNTPHGAVDAQSHMTTKVHYRFPRCLVNQQKWVHGMTISTIFVIHTILPVLPLSRSVRVWCVARSFSLRSPKERIFHIHVYT